MATEEEVRAFLNDFKTKLSIWDVLYLDSRAKNTQALIDLDIRPIDRKSVLEGLGVTDFSEGPKADKMLGGSDMWIFGKSVNSKEVYIKITLGISGSSVICISFHIAEHTMNYPFK